MVNGAAVDELLARTSSGGTTAWYLTDKLDSVRDVVSSAGSAIDHVIYDSFGSVTSETNAGNGDRFKYAGMERDSSTEEYFDQSRWYGPATGRFLIQDSLGFAAGDANPYRYVSNDPTDATDPTGNLQLGKAQPGKELTHSQQLWDSTMEALLMQFQDKVKAMAFSVRAREMELAKMQAAAGGALMSLLSACQRYLYIVMFTDYQKKYFMTLQGQAIQRGLAAFNARMALVRLAEQNVRDAQVRLKEQIEEARQELRRSMSSETESARYHVNRMLQMNQANRIEIDSEPDPTQEFRDRRMQEFKKRMDDWQKQIDAERNQQKGP
jgi:RHS repeat-associated protein